MAMMMCIFAYFCADLLMFFFFIYVQFANGVVSISSPPGKGQTLYLGVASCPAGGGECLYNIYWYLVKMQSVSLIFWRA